MEGQHRIGCRVNDAAWKRLKDMTGKKTDQDALIFILRIAKGKLESQRLTETMRKKAKNSIKNFVKDIEKE